MIPLLSFGLGCLVTAGIFLQAHASFGSSGYPFWALLFVNGAIATTGGTLVGLLGREEREQRPEFNLEDTITVPRSEWDQIQAQLILGRGATQSTGAIPVPLSRSLPLAGAFPLGTLPRGSRAPPPSEESIPASSAFATPSRDTSTSISSEKTIDELLRELEVITRPEPTPSPPIEEESVSAPSQPGKSPKGPARDPAPSDPSWAETPRNPGERLSQTRLVSPWAEDGLPAPAVAPQNALCETCQRRLGDFGPAVTCAIGGESMCADCAGRAKVAGHPGQCDHCAKLVKDLDQED